MYLQKVEELSKKIHQLQNEKHDLLEAWVEAEHPHKIGDCIEVNGYTHSGKQMIVTRLSIRKSHKYWEWMAFGAVLKKDGTPGAFSGEWSGPVNL